MHRPPRPEACAFRLILRHTADRDFFAGELPPPQVLRLAPQPLGGVGRGTAVRCGGVSSGSRPFRNGGVYEYAAHQFQAKPQRAAKARCRAQREGGAF